MIKSHDCKIPHVFQDKVYGKNKRVVNPIKKKDGGQEAYRCTVCAEVVS